MNDRTNVVCAVDDTRGSRRVVAVGRRIGRALGARILLVHAFDPWAVPVPPSGELAGTLSTDDLANVERSLAGRHLAEIADLLGDTAHETVLAEGDPRAELLRVLSARDAGLLVMGTSARKPLERLLQGSLSAELAVTAPCPAVVVTERAAIDRSGPLVAGYDGSGHGLRAARHGAALAAGLGCELLLVHVAEGDEPGAQASPELARALHAAAQRCTVGAERRVDVTVEVRRGDAVEELARLARERDAALLVMGHRGRSPIKEALLGSVTAGLVRTAGVPVVVAGPRSDAGLADG